MDLVVQHLAVHGDDGPVGDAHAPLAQRGLHGGAHDAFADARAGGGHAGGVGGGGGLGRPAQLRDGGVVVHQTQLDQGVGQRLIDRRQHARADRPAQPAGLVLAGLEVGRGEGGRGGALARQRRAQAVERLDRDAERGGDLRERGLGAVPQGRVRFGGGRVHRPAAIRRSARRRPAGADRTGTGSGSAPGKGKDCRGSCAVAAYRRRSAPVAPPRRLAQRRSAAGKCCRCVTFELHGHPIRTWLGPAGVIDAAT